jgi:hypothetical protein
VRDLLAAPKDRQDLKVSEDPHHGPFARGLITEQVDSCGKVHNLLAKGNKARTIAATLMNSTSSRAHTIFQVSAGTCLLTEDVVLECSCSLTSLYWKSLLNEDVFLEISCCLTSVYWNMPTD